jgi:nicotinate phosphoribosyltransferase
MDAFLRDLVRNLRSAIRGCATIPATRWNGVKSHRPLRAGHRPMSKVLVFSDNLDLAKAVDLYRHFAAR